MPYTIKLKNPLAGISSGTYESGENGSFIVEQFLTDSDGEAFYRAIGEMERIFLQPFIESRHDVSQISQCLILFDGNEATIYINELKQYAEMIATRAIKKGEPVTFEDCVGVSSLSFPDISIPIDKSIIFFFSVGWKRGMYFDFRPNHPDEPTQLVDIEYKLGMYCERLMYSHIFKYGDEVWGKAYNLGWFPFISLLGDGQKLLIFLLNRISENKSTENAEKRLIDFYDETRLNTILKRILEHPLIERHHKFIKVGITDYLQGGEENYIRAGSALFPRIEGILRDIYNPLKEPKQNEMSENLEDIVTNKTRAPKVFFPTHFTRYLKTFYFKYFSRKNSEFPLSRNTHGHGESQVEDYDQKSVLLLILMFDQLGRYLQLIRKDTNHDGQ